MKTFTWGVLLASASLLFGSCRKDPLSNLNSAESRIYITQFDSTANFTTYGTFSVSDSAALLLNGQYVGMVRDSADSLFIAGFEQNMASRGYVLVDSAQSPDLAVNVTHISNNYVGVDYFSDYGDYWDPYYWGYDGYGYDFPGYYAPYSVQESGLTYDIFDLKNAAANGKQLKDIWSALVQGQDVFDPANVPSEVDTLFAQSPYLKK